MSPCDECSHAGDAGEPSLCSADNGRSGNGAQNPGGAVRHPARLLPWGCGVAPMGAAGGAVAPAVPMGAAVAPPASWGSESKTCRVGIKG